MNPLQLCDVVKRAANRGFNLAHELDTRFVDIFQHIKDELERLELAIKEQTGEE